MSTDVISEVKAFKSPYSEELFPTQEALRAHIRTMKKREAAERAVTKKNEEIARLINRPRLEATSLQHLSQLLVECHGAIVNLVRGSRYDGFCSSRKNPAEHVNIKATLCDVVGGYCNKEKPVATLDEPSNIFYNGRINVFYKHTHDFFDSTFDLFRYIHRGTGGGSVDGRSSHRDLVLCLDDFPLMREAYYKQRNLIEAEVEGEKLIQDEAQKLCAADHDYQDLSVKREDASEKIAALRAQLAELAKEEAGLASSMRGIEDAAKEEARAQYPNLAKTKREALRHQLGIVDK